MQVTKSPLERDLVGMFALSPFLYPSFLYPSFLSLAILLPPSLPSPPCFLLSVSFLNIFPPSLAIFLSSVRSSLTSLSISLPSPYSFVPFLVFSLSFLTLTFDSLLSPFFPVFPLLSNFPLFFFQSPFLDVLLFLPFISFSLYIFPLIFASLSCSLSFVSRFPLYLLFLSFFYPLSLISSSFFLHFFLFLI